MIDSRAKCEFRLKSAPAPQQKPELPRPSDPGKLPGDRYILKVPTESHVRATAIADFHRLMFVERERDRRADPGVRLQACAGVDAIHAGCAAAPEVCVERHPHARPHVIT